MISSAMRQALVAGGTARRISPPNPWVGAVLVRDGEVVGVGATHAAGGPHAEVEALRVAGDLARGATLYVTLEPCHHRGRTGPCTEAIVSAGVSKVVVGVEDPDKRVSGQGLAALRAAGVAVEVGDGHEEISNQLLPYLFQRTTGRPFVVAKIASTLDGRVAMTDGSSQWITSEDARRDGHELRADSQAIVVGAGTIRSDNPRLTARLGDITYEPLRVVLGAAPDDAAVHPCREFTGDLGDLLDDLGREGVIQVLVEGGPRVVAAFVEAELVQKVVWYLAPALAGAAGGLAALETLETPTLETLRRGRFLSVRTIGEDVRIDLEVSWR